MNKALSFVFAAAFSVGAASAVSAQSILIDLNALTEIDARQVGSFVNIAVNNAEIDGSVTAEYEASAFLREVSEAAAGSSDASSTVTSAVAGALGDIDTTVIGAVNQGDITTGVTTTVDRAVAGSANAASDYTGPLMNSVAANLAFNQAELDAAVSISATDYALTAGNATTTAIGAVNTGSIAAGVAGTLADITVSVP